MIQEEKQSGFVAGTLVHTKEGLIPIEEIRVGDWVLSYPDDRRPPDHERQEHEYTYRKVTQTFVTDDQPVTKLIVSGGIRETIYLTANHPMYHPSRGWIPVCDVEVGDSLENFLFGSLLVFRSYPDFERSKVYNFEVDEFHTYYVSVQGFWVHNRCDIE